MTCYKCGDTNSPDGKLCPKCTKEKLESLRNPPPIILEPCNQPDGIERFYRTIRIISIALFCLAIGAYGLFSYRGLGLGMSKSEIAYQRCLDGVNELSVETKNQIISDTDKTSDPFGTQLGMGIANGFGAAIQSGGTELCKQMKRECDSNPNSNKCLAFIEISRQR